MQRVVIESPFAGNVDSNVALAKAACLHALQKGYSPYASHLFFPQMLDDLAPAQRELGIKAGFEWSNTAGIVWFCCYLGEKMSPGMVRAFDSFNGSKPMQFLRFDVKLSVISTTHTLTDVSVSWLVKEGWL